MSETTPKKLSRFQQRQAHLLRDSHGTTVYPVRSSAALDERQHCRLVFNQQHRQAWTCQSCIIVHAPAAVPERRVRRERQTTMKVAPAPIGVVVAQDLAAVFAHDAIADAQAQAGSLAYFLGGEERIEDAVGIRDAGAVVAEDDFREPFPLRRSSISMRAGRPVSCTAS